MFQRPMPPPTAEFVRHQAPAGARPGDQASKEQLRSRARDLLLMCCRPLTAFQRIADWHIQRQCFLTGTVGCHLMRAFNAMTVAAAAEREALTVKFWQCVSASWFQRKFLSTEKYVSVWQWSNYLLTSRCCIRQATEGSVLIALGDVPWVIAVYATGLLQCILPRLQCVGVSTDGFVWIIIEWWAGRCGWPVWRSRPDRVQLRSPTHTPCATGCRSGCKTAEAYMQLRTCTIHCCWISFQKRGLLYVVFVIAIDSAVLYSVTVRRHEPAVEQVKAGLQQLDAQLDLSAIHAGRMKSPTRAPEKHAAEWNTALPLWRLVYYTVSADGLLPPTKEIIHWMQAMYSKNKGAVDLTSRHQAQLRSRHLRLELDGAAFMTLLGALINNAWNGLRLHSIRRQLDVDRWQGLSQARRAMCRAMKFQTFLEKVGVSLIVAGNSRRRPADIPETNEAVRVPQCWLDCRQFSARNDDDWASTILALESN